ncbi:MAG TPA: hypothetical protein VER55_12720 [Ardenticatenaceae bacterium]|nr:hypothetical protein [Ardenticatenaceae bacterium]
MQQRCRSPSSRVGPSEAEAWLGGNPTSRNIRKAAVAAYARDMEADPQALNGETVKFNRPATCSTGSIASPR